MAYVTIMDACLDDKHNECPRYENLPPRSADFIAGGGHCICPCHGPVKQEWYEQVKAGALKKRNET